jgi:K+/H+ antiporter YhaU regulatory subunit KhtT
MDEMLRAEQETGQTLRLEELHVDEIRVPHLVEQLDKGELTISDIGQRTELMVVAIKRRTQMPGDDPYVYTPRGNAKLQRGDVLIVIATPDQRVKLYQEVLSHGSLEDWFSKLLS